MSAERVRDELVKLLLAPDPRAGLGAARRHRAGRPGAARAAGAAAGDRRAPPAQGRLRAHPDRARAGDRAGGPDGPDLVLRLAALLHDIGKPKTRRFEPGGGVSFHHHEVVGAKLTRGPAAGAAVPQGRGRGRRPGWSSCTCASTATATGSGPTRRSAATSRDAGPLLDRLHKLTRSDCTTRNRRKAAALSRAYDDLEERIAQLREQEELDAIRPDLDGNEIMAILGVAAGPGGRPGLAAPAGAAAGARPAVAARPPRPSSAPGGPTQPRVDHVAAADASARVHACSASAACTSVDAAGAVARGDGRPVARA